MLPRRAGCTTGLVRASRLPRGKSNMDATLGPCLILTAGGAGTGKTRLSQALVRRVPNAILLDKDRILGAWVDLVLRAAGEPADRDGRYYWHDVRPQEYRTLEQVAYDHLELGKVVVVDAPLRPELNDPAWVDRIRGECHNRGAGFLAVWLIVSPDTARRRMTARAEPRDRWKLDNWDEFLHRQPYDPPAGAGLVLRNEDADALESVLAQTLAAIEAAKKRTEGQQP
ncbi:MAG: ATP-binding protein [Zetaproteobacteria bacterium]|nr:MAG: ATP-binding protein [Zetaproteobacteria bacterium]